MPLPQHVFDPPFNIVRCSHAVLQVCDLDASRRFYETTIGLEVEHADSDALYLRGMEERNHHSLVLKRGPRPVAERLGFKVASEADLDRAQAFFAERQLPAKFIEVPFQGRTLHATDGDGNRIELYFKMDQAERILQQYGKYRGCHPQRIDHFNFFTRDVQASVDFYASLGFRLTNTRRAMTPTRNSPRLGCIARAACTTSPSPAAAARVCITSPTGCRARSTSFTSAM